MPSIRAYWLCCLSAILKWSAVLQVCIDYADVLLNMCVDRSVRGDDPVREYIHDD